MRSLWNDSDAKAFVLPHEQPEGTPWKRDVALRTYTSQLLGAAPELVLHGGGNTSVKSLMAELDGSEVRALVVKGSGWDLATIQPAGFAACRLAALLALCELEQLSDQDMVRGLRAQMLDPNSPTPSVEALLHALIPGKYVEHTHADAVLSILDQPDSMQQARELWGDSVMVLPYVMPGFDLARAIYTAISTNPLPARGCLVLDKHGIFTWDSDARESYERMIREVSRAEDYLTRTLVSSGMRTTPTSASALRVEGEQLEWELRRAEIGAVVRGVICSMEGGQRLVGTWSTCSDVMSLMAREDADELSQIGPITPDHVIRTKPLPLWLGDADQFHADSLRSYVVDRMSAYCVAYNSYFERNKDASRCPLERLDPFPRVVLVPGVGAFTLGKTLSDAKIARDIYEHSARVMQNAALGSGYRPTTEAELFQLEYWSLEQAKLKRGGEKGLARQIALVTGAAGGIGLATARALLSAGAHVYMTDRAPDRLASAAQSLAEAYGERVAWGLCELTDPGQVAEMVRQCVLQFGGLDHLVSNAGYAPTGLLHESEGDVALRQSLDVNLLSHQNVAREAACLFLRQGTGGSMGFNASKSAFNQGAGFGPYAVAKAALIALAKQYAVDLGQHGVRSNVVNADRIRTGLFDGSVLAERAAARGVSPDAYFSQNLLHRETLASDVADAFVWLCQANATTGGVITVDGGNAAAFAR